jgi:MFS family permease
LAEPRDDGPASAYLQRVLGFSALEAGLAFVPLAVSAGAGGPLAARLVDRFGVRPVVTVSFLATVAAALWLSRAPAGGAYAVAVLPAFAVGGLAFATAAVPLMAESVAEAGPGEKGVAAGLFQTFSHAGGAIVLAVVVIAALLAGYRLAFLLVAALLLTGAAAAGALLPRRGR